MLTPADILAIAEFNQRQIAAAIKIAAALIKRPARSPSARRAPSPPTSTTSVRAAVRTALIAIFSFKNGRVDFMTNGDRPDPWDTLTADDGRNLDAEITKQAQSNDRPLTAPQQKLYDTGAFPTKRAAVSFYFSQTRLYGYDNVVAAIDAAIAANAADPRSYVVATLQRRAKAPQAHGAAAPQRFPTRIPKFVKPLTPEAAKTTIVGWETTTERNPDGTPKWPAGTRRRIYRIPTGELRLLLPSPADTIPTMEQDPGCQIIG